jgi:2-oxoglutarate ferredoxin oxidoreductase subunit gamma
METSRIVFTGSGGQGIITVAIILGEAAAIFEGRNAVQTQSYGPEARGGASRADLVISDGPIRYPKVINPHSLVCLTQEAYHRYANIVRPGGLLLSDSRFVTVSPRVDARQVSLPMYERVLETLGKAISFNICVLGALVGLTRVVQTESLAKAIDARVPPETRATNQEALNIGLGLAEESGFPPLSG